jgi:putative sigma-54 modulation protein
MGLQITGKNMELSPEVRSYIERKLGKINRHLPNILESKVEVFEEKTKSPQQHFVVQVTVNSNGTLLRSEERGADLLNAINKVTTITNRRIEHYKGKLYDKRKGGPLTRNKLSNKTKTTQPPEKVVKVKRFTVNPMSVDEAIDRMELLGHEFFLFLNENTEEINLLYRRRDGNYGLIEPELG